MIEVQAEGEGGTVDEYLQDFYAEEEVKEEEDDHKMGDDTRATS